MLQILLSWLVLSAAFWITAQVLPGFRLPDFQGALRVSALFGVINWFIGWLLFVVLGVMSLGIGFLLAFLTRWIVNAILLKVTDAVSKSLSIDSFATALWGALLISALGTLGQTIVHRLL
jgi:putative membrane protein